MVDKRMLTPCGEQEREAAAGLVRDWNLAYARSMGHSRGVYVATFGCQQNQADSEKLLGMAVDMGYRPVETAEEADLILVNTCAIREHAENRALAMVGEYKHIRERNPDLIIGVCGCMVSQEHRRESLRKSYPYVTFTLGTSSLHQFPRVLWESIEKDCRVIRSECPEDMESEVAEGIPVHRASGYRAWVSVMYGCNNFCSYCIVPYVRGRERSREKADILREVQELVQAGYRDITLLGQNVNSYGRGLAEPCDFADLLSALDAIPGDWWLRFMTSHPKDASRKLIDVMATGKHIVPTFHLPLQSGSDRVLHAMNRRYDMAKYMDTVTYMKERIPRLTLTSDIIVGFPGEEEEDYQATLRALEAVQFDMLFAFIYSPRKGTPAAGWEQVPPEVKKTRYTHLMEVQDGISLARNRELVGQVVRVLCDGESKTNPALYSGRTEGNKSVFFAGTEAMVGRFCQVLVERVEPYALHGRVIDG